MRRNRSNKILRYTAVMVLITKSCEAGGLVVLATYVVFHGHQSIAVGPTQPVNNPGMCYTCVAFEGISNPQCEFPVARKAQTASCNTGANDMVRTTCGKLVVFSKGHKGGQTLKSWLMKRICLTPRTIKDRYDNLQLECNTCGKIQSSVRIFQGLAQDRRGGHRKATFPEEQEQLVVLMCVCCEFLCNAEEGFNLSYFQNDENSGILSSRSNAHYLMIVLSSQYTLYFLLNK